MEGQSAEKTQKSSRVRLDEGEGRRPHSQVLQEKLIRLQSKSTAKTNPDGKFKSILKKYWKFMLVFVVPLALLPLPIWGFHGSSFKMKDAKTNKTTVKNYGSESAAGFTLLVMVIFWITEALPLSITSLLPVVLYPLLGVRHSEEVSTRYFSDSILIFVGGLNLALAFEYSNLHKRIALRVILCFGTSVRRLLLGFVSTTTFLSMWMSNTAVAALMVPIVLAVTDELERCMQESLNKEFDEIQEAKEQRSSLEPSAKSTSRNVNAGGSASASDSAPVSVQASVPASVSGSQAASSGPLVPPSTKASADGVFKMSESAASMGGSRQLSKQGSQTSTLSEGDVKKLQRQLSMMNYLANTKSMFLLSIAYASNIGGTGVITGSGTNIVALGHLDAEQLPEKYFDKYAQVTFLSWLSFNFLPMLVNVFLAYWFLLFWFMWWGRRSANNVVPGLEDKDKDKKNKSKKNEDQFVVTKEIAKDIKESLVVTYKKLGGITCHEAAVLVVFALAVILWIFHDPKIFSGWSSAFKKEFRDNEIDYVSLTTPAIIINILLFTVPKNKEFYKAFYKCNFYETKYEPLLHWQYVHNKFPWGVILLLGGGFAMSDGVSSSGLGPLIGKWMSGLASLPMQVFLLIVCYFVAFFTEVASNTAVAQIFIPVLRNLCIDLCWHPLVLALPAAVASSYAFMLPVATPPNAIVFQAGKMKISQMAKPGMIMNMITTLVLFIFTVSWGEVVFGFSSFCGPTRPALLKQFKATKGST